MAAFQIPGMTLDAIKTASTAAPVGGGKPFPGALKEYVNGVTGEVTALSVKVIGDGEYFSVTVQNNGHVAEILISTDPNNTNPDGKKSQEDQAQENLSTLTKFVKQMEIYNTKGEVDPTRFGNAIGKLVTFTSRNKQSKDGKYVNTNGYYKGEAPVLIPVHTAPAAPLAATGTDDDLPF